MSTDNKAIRISAVGDISLGDHPVCVGHGMRSTFSKLGFRVLEEISRCFDNADTVIANLETVTSDLGLKPRKLASFEMRGNPEHLSFLRQAGIDVLCVANNHAMQHGEAAFWDTVSNVRDAGMDVIGLESQGRTNVHAISHGSVESHIFNVSMRPEEWAKDKTNLPYSNRQDRENLFAEVKRLRASCTGFLICSIHWGLEFLDYPSPSQVEIGRALIDAGVDVVLGHHSHVVQPVERYKQGVIFYSLGNFVFDLWSESTKQTLVAQVELEPGQRPKYSWVPIVIDKDFRLRIADQATKASVDSLLSWERFEKMENKPSTDEEYVERYKSEELRFRYSSYRYFLKNIIRYPPDFLFQSLARTAYRRLTGT
ncbi:CapA family protein [Marinobacter nauticus]|uniref:Capsule biosynthesis protein capA n=1 Tax=Marinobacter nauticus TaxID=2743 RepID=A0A833JRZ5_MARNT|nr:CapA family protein [Marinobacter nauticus]KAE8546987.1 Capsule biosynthesis protein capA [Marinobacter nauticus]